MTNFAGIPALKGFFQCLETFGNVLHCSCSDLTWDISSSGQSLIYNTESGGIGITADFTSPPINFVSGSICPTIDTDLCYVWVCAGRLTGTKYFRFSVGDLNEILPEYAGTGCGMGMSDVPFHAAIGNTGASISIEGNQILRNYAVTNGPTDVLVVLKYDGVNNTLSYTAYRVDTGATIMDAATTSDFTTVLGDLNFNPCFRYSGLEMYGAQLWEFSAFPSNLITGLLWQAQQWRLGRDYRSVYPDWAGPGYSGFSSS